MASTGPSDSAQATATQNIYTSTETQANASTSSTPMDILSSPSSNNANDTESGEGATAPHAQEPDTKTSTVGPSRIDEKRQDAYSETLQSPASAAAPNTLARSASTVIGPSSDELVPGGKDVEPKGSTLMITLLLINGARHPFKLDWKYLNKRNVEVQDNDPFNLSVYKLKELILREWREEWETKPSSPSSIRLISFGQLLGDKTVLKDSRFKPNTANVIHMSIKPQDIPEDEEAAAAKGGKRSSRSGGECEEGRRHGCRCVIL